MKIKRAIISLVLLIFLFRCAIPPPHPPSTEKRLRPISKKIPEVRIGIAEELESIQFKADGQIEIFDKNGLLAQQLSWREQWEVKLTNTQPSIIKYRLRYKEVQDRKEADRILEKLTDQDLPVIIERIKKRMFRETKLDWVTSYIIILEPEFETEEQAYKYQWRIRDKITTIALPFLKTPPTGNIILTNTETGESYQSTGMLRIRADVFTLNLKTGEGFHFSNNETRKYHDQIDFIIDRFGKLTVINVLPLETYLMGVVGSEMQEKFPIEALKAQAITARSFSLARIGKQHLLSPFDLCDEVHCHVYGGIDRESARVKKAVLETKGLILMYNNKICDTFYAGVCGGFTENNEYVWEGEPRVYLKGKLDADLNSFSNTFLQNEKNVRLWIESSPNVFCNTQKEPVPDYLKYTTKYFRWQVRYSQTEISNIIRKKTGENIGRLLKIIPVSRGVSGRLNEIKLEGTRKTITVEKQLSIRKALSENYLYSSCFVVDRNGSYFIIKGAGWGHGVGMCQTGAAMMALQGFGYREILSHYYQNTEIVKLY